MIRIDLLRVKESPLAINRSFLAISKSNFAKFKRGFICSAIDVAVCKLVGILKFGKKARSISSGAFDNYLFKNSFFLK